MFLSGIARVCLAAEATKDGAEALPHRAGNLLKHAFVENLMEQVFSHEYIYRL